MRRAVILYVLIGVIACLFSSCNNLDQQEDESTDQEINVVVGKEFTISTRPDASTGWRLWLKGYDRSFLILVEDKAVPDTFQAHDFIFRALKKGKTEITMELKPYWWDDIPPDKQQNYPVSTTIFSVIIN